MTKANDLMLILEPSTRFAKSRFKDKDGKVSYYRIESEIGITCNITRVDGSLANTLTKNLKELKPGTPEYNVAKELFKEII